MDYKVQAFMVVIDRLAQKAKGAADAADWAPIVRMAACHSTLHDALKNDPAFVDYKRNGDILERKVKVFFGWYYDPYYTLFWQWRDLAPLYGFTPTD